MCEKKLKRKHRIVGRKEGLKIRVCLARPYIQVERIKAGVRINKHHTIIERLRFRFGREHCGPNDEILVSTYVYGGFA